MVQKSSEIRLRLFKQRSYRRARVPINPSALSLPDIQLFRYVPGAASCKRVPKMLSLGLRVEFHAGELRVSLEFMVRSAHFHREGDSHPSHFGTLGLWWHTPTRRDRLAHLDGLTQCAKEFREYRNSTSNRLRLLRMPESATSRCKRVPKFRHQHPDSRPAAAARTRPVSKHNTFAGIGATGWRGRWELLLTDERHFLRSPTTSGDAQFPSRCLCRAVLSASLFTSDGATFFRPALGQ